MMDGTGNIGSQEEESAKVTLMPGDIVFTSKPFVAVLNRDLKFKVKKNKTTLPTGWATGTLQREIR